jgi:hypothetical protein
MEIVQKPSVHIIDNKGAPPELVRIAQRAGAECAIIKTIVFDAFIDKLKGSLGAFDPNNGTVIVDMGNCIHSRRWMKKGVMYIPNVWFNLVFALFHEVAHAFQLEEDPELLDFKILPQEFEDEANTIAEDSLLEWSKDGVTPKLSEMNWVGEQIKSLLNRLYAQTPHEVVDELAVEGTTAVANALHAALISSQYENKEDLKQLLDSIDQGYVGIIVGGKRYFTAYDAINTTHQVKFRRPHDKPREDGHSDGDLQQSVSEQAE